MVNLKDIRIGSAVIVRGNFGRAPALAAVVDEVEEDIKNGQPGISYNIPGEKGSGTWAYLSQVDRVITY